MRVSQTKLCAALRKCPGMAVPAATMLLPWSPGQGFLLISVT